MRARDREERKAAKAAKAVRRAQLEAEAAAGPGAKAGSGAGAGAGAAPGAGAGGAAGAEAGASASAAAGAAQPPAAHAAAAGAAAPAAAPVAFLFPGQGSQAVGMLKVPPLRGRMPRSAEPLELHRPAASCRPRCVFSRGTPQGAMALWPAHACAPATLAPRAAPRGATSAQRKRPRLGPVTCTMTKRALTGRAAAQDSKDVPAVKEMLAVARRVLGYDLLQARRPACDRPGMPPTASCPSTAREPSGQASVGLPAGWLSTGLAVSGARAAQVCLEGPQARLDDTAIAQPALFVAGLVRSTVCLTCRLHRPACPLRSPCTKG